MTEPKILEQEINKPDMTKPQMTKPRTTGTEMTQPQIASGVETPIKLSFQDMERLCAEHFMKPPIPLVIFNKIKFR